MDTASIMTCKPFRKICKVCRNTFLSNVGAGSAMICFPFSLEIVIWMVHQQCLEIFRCYVHTRSWLRSCKFTSCSAAPARVIIQTCRKHQSGKNTSPPSRAAVAQSEGLRFNKHESSGAGLGTQRKDLAKVTGQWKRRVRSNSLKLLPLTKHVQSSTEDLGIRFGAF